MGAQLELVTVISGNPGGGKTTTLDHLMRESDDCDIGVLVNDMSEVDIDTNLAAESLPFAQTLTLEFDQSDLDPIEFYEESQTPEHGSQVEIGTTD